MIFVREMFLEGFFLRDWKCNLVCLQETKLVEVLLSGICSLWGAFLC